jgi:nitrogen fixation protein
VVGWVAIDIIYSEVVKVVTVPRGLGTWGDMVLTLKDGSRLELRAVPKFREVYEYINQKLSVKAQKVSGPLGQQDS